MYFRGLKLYIPSNCFPPRATVSTSLLANALEVFIRKHRGPLLDIGSSVGQLPLLAAKAGIFSVGCEIDVCCLKASRINALINDVYTYYAPVACWGASCFRDNCFGIIVINPPFLPLDPSEQVDLAICGGGDLSLTKRLLESSIPILKEKGILLYTLSSFATRIILPRSKILKKRWGLFDHIFVLMFKKLDQRSSPPSHKPGIQL